MAAPSITIKIDFGTEGGSQSAVSLGGAVPTPMSSGASAAASTDQSASVVPTPFGNAGQMVGQVDSSAGPPPSPSLVPGGVEGSASSGSGSAEIPTPFSAGGFAASSVGQSVDAVPTPFDSPQGNNVAAYQAPAPQGGDGRHADRTAPPAPQPQEGAAKKSK